MSRKNDHSDSAQDAAADLPPGTGELAGAPDVVSQPEEADEKPRKPGSDKVQRFRERRKAGVIAVLRHPIRKDHVERLQKIDQLYGLHMGTEVLDAENVDDAVVFGAFDKVLDLAIQHHPLIALKMDLQALGAGQTAPSVAEPQPTKPPESLPPHRVMRDVSVGGVNGATTLDLKAGQVVTDQALLNKIVGIPGIVPADCASGSVRVHACRSCPNVFEAADEGTEKTVVCVAKEACQVSVGPNTMQFRVGEIVDNREALERLSTWDPHVMPVEAVPATMQTCTSCGDRFPSPFRGLWGRQLDQASALPTSAEALAGIQAMQSAPAPKPPDTSYQDAKYAAINAPSAPLADVMPPNVDTMPAHDYERARSRAVMGWSD